MRSLSFVRQRIRSFHPLTRLSLFLGFALMLWCYILAALFNATAFTFPDPLHALAIVRSAIETAPACLAAGVCAGLIGDLLLGSCEKEGADDTDSEDHRK